MEPPAGLADHCARESILGRFALTWAGVVHEEHEIVIHPRQSKTTNRIPAVMLFAIGMRPVFFVLFYKLVLLIARHFLVVAEFLGVDATAAGE